MFYRWPTRDRTKIRKTSLSVAVRFEPRAGPKTMLCLLFISSPSHPSPPCRQPGGLFTQAHCSHRRAHHSATCEVHGQKPRQPPPSGCYAWTVKCTRKQMASCDLLNHRLGCQGSPVSNLCREFGNCCLKLNIFWQRHLTIY